MYCECPKCGREFHLRLAMPLHEWLARFDPEGKYPNESPKLDCWFCWRDAIVDSPLSEKKDGN